MLIGELSQHTGVSTRMLRYYEEQGLITARRLSYGYRDFHPSTVHRVARIREMLASHIPTAAIRTRLTESEGPGQFE